MNTIRFEPTTFIGRDGVEDYGYRACDDYASTYYDGFESLPYDDFVFLKAVMQNLDETASEMIRFCIEEQKGLSIGGVLYDYDEIKSIINP